MAYLGNIQVGIAFVLYLYQQHLRILTGSLRSLADGAHNTETRTMQDNLRLSRLAYPRATLITVISLSLLIMSVGLFADTSTEPLAMAELLANNGLLTQFALTFS